LESAHSEQRPKFPDRVLLNPATGPILFRDTPAIDMLLKRTSLYNVAKTLGDTVAVVEVHYAPYVRELRERTRRIMESPERIERQAENCTVLRTYREQKPMYSKNKRLNGGWACKPDSVRQDDASR
jgi:hypothetical protein